MKKDINDTLREEGPEGVRRRHDKAKRHEPKANGQEIERPPLTLSEWLDRDIPPADFLMGEWLSTTTRGIIAGATGLGKTMFGLALSIAIADKIDFLHWRSIRKARVLYVDGEMSRRLMKRRLKDAVRRAGVKPEGLVVLSKEDFENMPPLNSEAGQKWMDVFIAEHGPFDLIIFDNIQALLVGDMKDEEQWAKVLPWVKSLTRRSIGQLWFHHTGHDETRSYGSKAREWQMDIVGILERTEGDDAELSFTLKFTKARERTPDNRDDFEPVTMKLVGDQWTHSQPSAAKVTGAKQVALDLLKRAICDAGELPPASNHIPPSVRVVRLDLWRRYCEQGTISASDKPDTQQRVFRRAAKDLQAIGKVGVWGELVWAI